jgi:hypothetical protein
MQNILTLPQNHTMTSVEVVEVINALRPETAAVLTHDNFMKRCVRVATELGGVSTDGTYIDAH